MLFSSTTKVVRLLDDDLDSRSISALLSAACIGDYAVCAALIAAKNDIDPGCEVAVASRHRDILYDVDGIYCQHLAAQVNLLQQCVNSADCRGLSHVNHSEALCLKLVNWPRAS